MIIIPVEGSNNRFVKITLLWEEADVTVVVIPAMPQAQQVNMEGINAISRYFLAICRHQRMGRGYWLSAAKWIWFDAAGVSVEWVSIIFGSSQYNATGEKYNVTRKYNGN